MENQKLSGIERDLVLQYLIDGNVPVTITLIEDQKDDEIHSVSSQIFPIAIKSEHIKANENGKIFLENPPEVVKKYKDKTVKVEFYFNRVGLFFISDVKTEKDKLFLLLPDKIDRIKDEEEKTDYDFSVVLYFEYKSKKETNIFCIPWEKESLFSRPAWKTIPLENQKKAKELLEHFVEEAKIEKNAGNGIQLISICKYLTDNEQAGMESLQNRVKPLSVLYVDHERLVLGMEKNNCNFNEGEEFGAKLCFSIKTGPINERNIFVTCVVNKIYKNDEESKVCVDFRYTTLQEEDMRYLYEKATSTLFN